jgi:hydrogenase nickel incorporation protein HypA/HybF
MHELSICQALMRQVEQIALREDAAEVTRIVVRIGPLSGVVPELLEQAFSIARSGTIAKQAELSTEHQPVMVKCTRCGSESEATPNRLICARCGDYRTRLIAGDELILASVELNRKALSEIN